MRWSELGRAEKYNSLQVTSAEMGYPDFAVEKDWWVIEILRVISSMPVSKKMFRHSDDGFRPIVPLSTSGTHWQPRLRSAPNGLISSITR